ncbi:MAG: hypothetical protein A4E38_00379 [Methanoregulaceae archaeon PtaB.Bin108]|nr:MAG: hypothetical protein A4E38_00379 [Methanoregulaceae archaeon PtaB.Bin108]
MDRTYWIVFFVLIAIILYAIITSQFIIGASACLLVLFLALLHSGQICWNYMEYKYWVISVIIIVILLYTILTFQFMIGIIGCAVIILLTWILSLTQQKGRPDT